jgi:dihydroceramidase
MQLLDELSMIYLTCTTFFALFSYGRKPLIKILVLVFIVSLGVFVTLYYHYLKDPVFHQNAFTILAATVIFKGLYKTEVLLRPSQERKNSNISEFEHKRRGDRDRKIRNTMWALAFMGIASVLLGFAIWNLDNMYCVKLRRWRRDIGLPWGILLEGHGWWYVFLVLRNSEANVR